MKYPTIRIEGSILSSDILDKIEQSDILGQNPKDFGFDTNTKVKDEIAIAWADAQSYWKIYKRKIEKLKNNETGASETRQSWIVPFLGLLGYQIDKANAEILNEKTYAISHRAINFDGFPIHIMGCNELLDRKPETGLLRMSPHSLVQEYLNLTEHLYAIVTNGYQLRILRDASRLVKLSYLEFNLEQMFEEDIYSDFALMYRLIHASRMPKKIDEGAECLFEKYHQDALESGSRIREGLSKAVAESIKIFADGFMNNPANQALRVSIDNNTMDSSKLYQIMLRLIYRILFLTVIEERNLIYPKNHNKQKREIYYNFYSLSKLRKLCEIRYVHDTHYNDLWVNLKQIFKLFEDEKFGASLDIMPLNGDLFGYNAFDIINDCELDNKTLLTCIRNLSLFANKNGNLQRVNYASLNVEEFGSVYEGLLEFTPQIIKNETYQFVFAKGDERSKTGSHYTPDELVKPLIKHSLEYIIEDKLAESKRLASCEWQVVKKENNILSIIHQIYKNEFVSRFGSMEKGNEHSKTDLSSYQNVPERGTIRNDISNEKGGNFDPSKSSGGLGQTENERVSSIYKNSERKLKGTGNPSDISTIRRDMHSNSNRTNYEGTRNIEQTDPKFTTESFNEIEIDVWWKNLSILNRYSLFATHHLLTIRVCDIACGSGHILLSAARRLAHEVAKARTGEDQPSPEAFREAIRYVIRNCIYGVDKNPLAVELCKVSLWLEAHNPGEPLSFLDHKIKCGDSIVGLAHKEELEKGIADEAFKRMPNDDKDIASLFAKKNKDEKKHKDQIKLDFQKEFRESLGKRAKQMLDFINMPEHTPQHISAKKKRFEELNSDKKWWRLKTLADIQTAQFFIPKTQENKDYLVTESEYRQYLSHEKPFDARKSGKAIAISQEKKFFHWFLEFPEIFAVNSEDLVVNSLELKVNSSEEKKLSTINSQLSTKSGFDCILGNPPYLGDKKLKKVFGDCFLEYVRYYYKVGINDLVVYFFNRIFNLLKYGNYQALITTSSISQGDLRIGALENINGLGGEILFGIKSIKWPGIANLNVSLIVIKKGNVFRENRILNNQKVNFISSFLTSEENIGEPFNIKLNEDKMFTGYYFLGDGFLLTNEKAQKIIEYDDKYNDVIFPFINGDDLNDSFNQKNSRSIINFFDWPLNGDYDNLLKEPKGRPYASDYPICLDIIEELVKPERQRWKLDENGIEIIGEYALRKPLPEKWWIYGESRSGLRKAIEGLNNFFVTAQTTKYLNFINIESRIAVSQTAFVLASERYETFIILQSTIHYEWAVKYGNSKGDTFRYAPSKTFESFPFPKKLTKEQEQNLEKLGKKYHEHRKQLMLDLQLGLTKTYNQFHNPQLKVESLELIVDSLEFRIDSLKLKEIEKKYGKESANLVRHFGKGEPTITFDEAVAGILKLRELHVEMDNAVLEAYGWTDIGLRHDFYEVDYLPENDRIRFTIHPDARKEILKRLLELNHKIHEEEVAAGLWDKKKGVKKKVEKKEDIDEIF